MMGRGDVSHWRAAHLRHYRFVGGRPPGPVAYCARVRRRRSVGRRRVDDGRARACREARFLRQLASDWRARRAPDLDDHFFTVRQVATGSVPCLGLARTVSDERGAGRGRPDHPLESARDAFFHKDEGDTGGRAPAYHRGPSPLSKASAAGRRHACGRERFVLHLQRVHACLRHAALAHRPERGAQRDHDRFGV